MKQLRADGVRLLAQAEATVGAAGVKVDSVLHDGFKGTVHELVIADVARRPADLIVLRSSAEDILRHAPTSSSMPSPYMRQLNNVLLPLELLPRITVKPRPNSNLKPKSPLAKTSGFAFRCEVSTPRAR